MTNHTVQLIKNDLLSSIDDLVKELQNRRSASSIQTFFDARMDFIRDQFKDLLELEKLKMAD
jgi:molecular chaperone GrpE (heat shock protein)